MTQGQGSIQSLWTPLQASLSAVPLQLRKTSQKSGWIKGSSKPLPRLMSLYFENKSLLKDLLQSNWKQFWHISRNFRIFKNNPSAQGLLFFFPKTSISMLQKETKITTFGTVSKWLSPVLELLAGPFVQLVMDDIQTKWCDTKRWRLTESDVWAKVKEGNRR